MPIVETNSENVKQVNQDTGSMTNELRQMASAAKELEKSLNGVNNELSAISKLTNRSAKQMTTAVKETAKAEREAEKERLRQQKEAEKARKKADEEYRKAHTKDRYKEAQRQFRIEAQAQKKQEHANNVAALKKKREELIKQKQQQKHDEILAKYKADQEKAKADFEAKQAAKFAKANPFMSKADKKYNKLFSERTTKALTRFVTGEGILSPLTIAFATLTKAAKDLVRGFNDIMPKIKEFGNNVHTVNTDFSATANYLQQTDIQNQLEKEARDYKKSAPGAWLSARGRDIANVWTGLITGSGVSNDDTISQLAREKLLAQKSNIEKGLREHGIQDAYTTASGGTGSISSAISIAAAKEASKYAINAGLTAPQLIETEQYKEALNRYTSMALGSVDNDTSEGFIASLLGESYVPGVTRSADVKADYITKMIDALSDMSFAEQQDALSSWANAGTVLNQVGKNLYSFDEVISQDAIEVDDKKASEILGNILTDLKDKDNILKDMGANLDNIAGGTDGTGPSDAVKDAIHSSLEENQETIGKLQAGEGRHRITGNFISSWASGQEDGTYRSGSLYSDSKYVYELQQHSDATGKILESEWKTLGTLDQWIAKMSGNFNSRYERINMKYLDLGLDDGVTAGDQAALAAKVAAIYEVGNRSHGLATTLTSDKNNDAFNINTGGSSGESGGGGHGFAIGGVGTHRVDGATLFENGPEAVIPLSSQEGINYLSNAMKEAGGTGSNINVTVELSGINIADNDRQWNEVARNIGERINTIIRREGSV